MALDQESKALAEAVGLMPQTAAADLFGEGETAEDARWFDRERLSQDKLRSIEARHLPSGKRLFRNQIRAVDELAAAIETATGKGGEHRTNLDPKLLEQNARAGEVLAAAIAGHAQVTTDVAAINQRLTALSRRDDARFFAAEVREIQAHVDKSLRLGQSSRGGWHQAGVSINGAKTWLDRLESDLKQIDAMPGGWRALATDRRDLPSKARAAIDQRAFRAARLMTAERCDPRDAIAMSRRAEQAIAAGCPETSALMNERVRRELLKQHPQSIVDALTRMLRMEGTADRDDAIAVLKIMTRLPSAMATQLAEAGVTILPSPGGPANAAPDCFLTDLGDHAAGFFSQTDRTILVKTTHAPANAHAVVADVTTPLHEAAHAYEFISGRYTHRDADFVAARDKDLAQGHVVEGRDDYFREPDEHLHSNPVKEAFVQSLAMYLIGDRRWPAMHAHWHEKFSAKSPASGR
ncbi:hypothetical protein CDN99_14635 [Roseateles aquatilis]|uniref:Uncharacterized protein n=2 Tax=Roseateles aquatilis TaxID=431061 RepID=A0A246J856_9BURK|nr:hypothetical protein CDN99_14635 [Roseateles aquatilis]